MRKEIDRFTCVGQDGKRYTLVAFQNYANAATLEHPNRVLPTTKAMQLLNGDPVNVIDDSTFEIVATGETIRRSS